MPPKTVPEGNPTTPTSAAEKKGPHKTRKVPRPVALAKRIVKRAKRMGRKDDSKPKKTNTPFTQRAKAVVNKVVRRKKTKTPTTTTNDRSDNGSVKF